MASGGSPRNPEEENGDSMNDGDFGLGNADDAARGQEDNAGDEEDMNVDDALPEVGEGNELDEEEDEPGQEIVLMPKGSYHVHPQGFLEVGDGPVLATLFEATWALDGPVGGARGQRGGGARRGGADSRNTGRRGGGRNSRRVNIFPGNNGGPGPTGGGGGGGGAPLPRVTFQDCGGVERQIKFIETSIIDPLRDRRRQSRFGIQPPRGVMFYGPPGTGKTRLAQALGNQLQTVLGRRVHFIYRKGGDMLSKYFGESQNNLRRIFNEATMFKPSVIFFDELDGLCPSRNKEFLGEAYVTVVTTMLGLMDNLPVGEVFVVGATNRLEDIDPALRRPGRFDKHLEFLPPDQQGRLEILRIHTRPWRIRPSDALLQQISQKTPGFSGADLATLCLISFDKAVDRLIPPGAIHPTNLQLRDLRVQEQDWTDALKVTKATNAAVFGSTLYTHPPPLGDHLNPLLEDAIPDLAQYIRQVLTSQPIEGGVKSLYIFHDAAHFGEMSNYIVASALRSNHLDGYPVYCLSSEVLFKTPYYNWSKLVSNVFTQASESHLATILYCPDIEDLWQAICNFKIESTLNLEHQMKRLWGKRVLLLATGTMDSSEFADNNPFRRVFAGPSRAQFVDQPQDEYRQAFFKQLIDAVPRRALTKNQQEKWEEFETEVMNLTKDKSFHACVVLYEQLLQAWRSSPDLTPSEVLAKFRGVLTLYARNGLDLGPN